jgi:hypothetical protein
LLISATLTAAFIEAFIILREQPWQVKSARAAMTWIPFLIMCGVAVGSWVGALLLGSKVFDAKAHDHWQKLFLSALRYDLFWSEVGTLGAVAITFGVVPAVGVLAYFSARVRRMLRLPSTPGESAHRMIAIMLAVGPFALMAGGLVFWITFITGSPDASKDLTILQIYSVSALRLSAIFSLLLPFAREILDVAGDVVFHLQPANSKLCSQTYTLPRLTTLLNRLRNERNGNAILVLAHSQGSVIAWTALCANQTAADILVTIGSPLSTLYARLLGGDYGIRPPSSTIRWRNLFRDGDYIGGAVTGCPSNESMGPGEHTDYWKDSKLIERLIVSI